MSLRVLQFSTGRVGSACVKAILSHPELSLAGVGVNNPDKIGVDVGHLIDSDPIGMRAVSFDDLVALDADCVVHTPVGERRPDETVDEICRLLESGKNVTSTALMSLVHPAVMEPAHQEKINAACKTGKSTFHATGINPGFFSDVMTMTLSGLCYGIERVSATEIYSYEAHTSKTTIDLIKLGYPPEEGRKPRVSRIGPAEPAMYILAEAMGFKLDEVKKDREDWVTPETFDIAAARIEKGTLAAYRNIYRGFSNGREILTFEFIGRAASHCAPEWAAPASEGLHRWENRIYGTPEVVSSVEVGAGDPSGLSGAVATGMRAVNAVLPVCKSPPGIVTMNDLGLLTAPLQVTRSKS